MCPQARRSSEAIETFRNLDWPTIVIYLIMVFAGMVSIYAASYDFDEASMFSYSEFSGKQLLWIGLSLVLGFVLLMVNARMYETYAYPIYVVLLVLLFITPFVAHDIKGSRSWISLGPMSLQPAEFAKFATALALAKLFSGYHFVLNSSWKNYARALAIIFLPILLILAQNETGSALTFMALFFVLYREGMSGLILFAAMFAVVIFVVGLKFAETAVGGMPTGEFAVLIMTVIVSVVMAALYSKRFQTVRNLLIWYGGVALLCGLLAWAGVALPLLPVMLGAIGVATVYLAILAFTRSKLWIPVCTTVLAIGFLFSVNMAFDKVLQPHQQMRIKVALGIVEDLRGTGYNVNQSKIAIGSGGFAGKGFLNGTQTKLKYVPEQHTDFIFCTIGEEEGFVGSALVTLLFLALILRVIAIGERQPNTFTRVYAYCVASYFIFHFCINIGMVIGLCPVIGIPLPFFSYGGSSLWGFTILLFVLLKLDASRKTVL
ncbi:MAG: rod shape-determining protein RodA [Muribaculaceae bacterium]|nr:rod shape-determining protein RodA [Muribaculaceae bacterium]